MNVYNNNYMKYIINIIYQNKISTAQTIITLSQNNVKITIAS